MDLLQIVLRVFSVHYHSCKSTWGHTKCKRICKPYRKRYSLTSEICELMQREQNFPTPRFVTTMLTPTGHQIMSYDKCSTMGETGVLRALARKGWLCIDAHVYIYVHIYIYINTVYIYIYIYIWIYIYVYTCRILWEQCTYHILHIYIYIS